jgi:hypothetical protein
VSLTFLDLSPKIAWISFSSGDNSPSLFGVILPTIISPHLIVDQILIIPSLSKYFNFAKPTPGISLVVSSGHNLVSATSISYSSILTEVRVSSFTSLSDITIASS